MYNEMVILKLVQSMAKQMASPPEIFRDQVLKHFQDRGEAIYERIKGYMDLSVTEDLENGELSGEHVPCKNVQIMVGWE